MSCKQFSDALAEAALGGAQDAALRSHLAGCASCGHELERLRLLAGAMDHSISEMAKVEPSPAFAARVRARVAEESAARAAWWRGWIPALAGGAAALALIAWLLWTPANVHAPTPAHDVAENGKAGVSPKLEPQPVEPKSEPRREPQEEIAAVRPRKDNHGLKPAAQPALPEVLITGDEWNQVVKLYALAQRGQVNAEAVAPPDANPLEQKFAPMVIAELKPIPPLGESPQSAQPRR